VHVWPQGDVLVALGKIQATALTFLRAVTPFAPPGTGGEVPKPFVPALGATPASSAPAQPARAAAAAATAPSASSGAAASATPGRKNLVHKTHRTFTVSSLPHARRRVCRAMPMRLLLRDSDCGPLRASCWRSCGVLLTAEGGAGHAGDTDAQDYRQAAARVEADPPGNSSPKDSM
jgi:hypothetical protein